MLRKICGFLTTILIIILAAAAIVLIAPRLMGYQSLAVLSGSMEPGIPVGSIVFTKEADPALLEVGDVVTYRLSGNTMVTHRVIENDTVAEQLIMQGDANETPDASPVAYSNVVGKVAMHLPFLGYISIYIKTPLGIAGACGFLVILILLTFLPEVFTSEKDKEEKEENKKE